MKYVGYAFVELKLHFATGKKNSNFIIAIISLQILLITLFITKKTTINYSQHVLSAQNSNAINQNG